ncbi:ShlB/FhaC/HecB family hemolysin secretion/activation protein [Pseudorhodobacter sp. W20_MBD10_FR17]|uniref:ShlB/FhaC/HecB family hemolysin secretion/activation protein n=1 Tax=Pseudorhodobacter sp. W20_MBD10_FR17 TaxID=3240266 RepID=UPI003F9C6C7D
MRSCFRRLSVSSALVGCVLVGVQFEYAQMVNAAPTADLSAKLADQNIDRLDAIDQATTVKQDGPGVVADPLNRRDLPPRGGATVVLKSITFAPPSAFLSDAELETIAVKYRSKAVDFSQISELVRDVNDLYAEKGVVTAAAILPPQNLADGNLQVRLVEGQVGNVALVGDHVSKNDYIFGSVRLSKGTTVDVPTAGSDIELFNRTNRAQLRLLLQPGAEFGYTDLLLGITEPPQDELQFYIDNEGVESTGELQASFLYRRYGIMGRDDTFLAYVATSEGSMSGTARYEFPINTRGTRLAASYTASDVTVVSGPTKILKITGASQSASLSVTHPLFLNDKWTVLGTGSAFYGENKSWSAGVPLVDSGTIKYAPGVSMSYKGDKGSMATQVQAVFANSKDVLAGTSRDIFLLAGSVNGQYRFENGLTFIGSGAWQHTRAKLVPGNLLFQIGGPSTVRGYPSDGIAGDSGFYGRLELHDQIPFKETSFDAFAFTDVGAVYSTFPKSTTLVSTGVGVNFSLDDKTSFGLSLAVPLKKSLTNQSDFVISGTLMAVAR